MSEIYISVDIETDGPIPGSNSMLSLGAAAFTAERKLLGTFSVNFMLLDGAKPDEDTMKWWATQPAAWKAAREDQYPEGRGMAKFAAWVKEMTMIAAGSCVPVKDVTIKPVFVGYPAGFDFLFVYWYLIKFLGTSPFSFSALDIKTYAAAVLGIPFREVNKRTLERYLEPGLKHTHVAVDDALEQGYLFLNLKAARDMRPALVQTEPAKS